MTRVDFHSQVADKLNYACRLIRKARAADCQILVLTDDTAQCKAIDEALWNFSGTDFLPHVMADDALATQTPIVITDTLQTDLPHHDVLINLSQHLPTDFQTFNRVIEIVSSEDADAQLGRARFRQYQQTGIKPTHTVATTK